MVQVISLEMLPFIAVVRSAHGDPIPRLVRTKKTEGDYVVNFEVTFSKRLTALTATVIVSAKKSLAFLICDLMPLHRGFRLVYRKTLTQQHNSQAVLALQPYETCTNKNYEGTPEEFVRYRRQTTNNWRNWRLAL